LILDEILLEFLQDLETKEKSLWTFFFKISARIKFFGKLTKKKSEILYSFEETNSQTKLNFFLRIFFFSHLEKTNFIQGIFLGRKKKLDFAFSVAFNLFINMKNLDQISKRNIVLKCSDTPE